MENKAEDILEMIEDHPLVKQIAAKKVAEILHERKKNASAISALKAELSRLPDPEEAVRKQQAKLARLESSAAQLRSEITRIMSETRGARMRIEGRIKLLEADLMESSEAMTDNDSKAPNPPRAQPSEDFLDRWGKKVSEKYSHWKLKLGL